LVSAVSLSALEVSRPVELFGGKHQLGGGLSVVLNILDK
jgi:hypothetical protein